MLPFYKNIPHERLEAVPGVDAHPNEIAHRIASEALYRWLLKRQAIPETNRAKVRTKIRSYGKTVPARTNHHT